MTLDEAISQCSAALYANSTTRMSREALGMLLDHAAASQAPTAPTLRDQFAMHAPQQCLRWLPGGAGLDLKLTAAARWAYADAMMERRS